MMSTEQTFALLKPDTVQRGLIGEVLRRIEGKGLRIAAMKLIKVSTETAQQHYAVHEGKPFYEGLVKYITSSPVVALVLEGPNAVAQLRLLVGATKPNEAVPGSIRGDLGVDISNNLVHASDSVENAQHEISVYFSKDELVQYERAVDRWLAG
jgi:nucleoside-diphosphate kinase